jgi:hypothetical protein
MSRVAGDEFVAGTLSANAMKIPAGTITDAAVAAGASIVATKIQHQYDITYAQPNTTASTETRVVHKVYGATATVVEFDAGLIAACTTGATVTVDLKKNGTSILSSVITIDHTIAALATVAAAIASASLVTGDVLEEVITATAGGGTLGTGFFSNLVLREDPQ